MALMTPQGLRGRAYSLLQSAKKSGKIPTHVGLDCADCGAEAIGYDHRDYSKPLDVDPVCYGCNAKRGQGWPATDSAPVEVSWCEVSDVEEEIIFCGHWSLKQPWEQGIPTKVDNQ